MTDISKNAELQQSCITAVSGSIFLIKKLWLDSMENEYNSAKGYNAFGYVTTEDEAIEFCKKGKMYDKKACWALSEDTPQFIYVRLEYCH